MLFCNNPLDGSITSLIYRETAGFFCFVFFVSPSTALSVSIILDGQPEFSAMHDAADT